MPRASLQPGQDPGLAAAFQGRRGRLLIGLLLTEFAAAVQTIAYSTVLPLAARELDGHALYGATFAAGTFTTILVLASGFALRSARRALFVATVLYVAGVLLAATAPSMWLVLFGSVVRGAATGLLAGFGLSAIGGLFDDALRPRVLGLFAVVWLLPSVAGPPLNGLIATTVGWRWALVWPAVLLLVARAVIGRHVDLVPWTPGTRRLDPRQGVLVVIGILVAATAPATHSWWGLALLAVGIALAAWATRGTIASLIGSDRHRMFGLLVLVALTLAYFGGDGLIALAAVQGLDAGAFAAAIAVGAGLVAWSLTGARPMRATVRDPIPAALAALAVALAGVASSQLLSRGAGLGVLIAAWTLGGWGMGVAYRRLYSAPFDDLAREQVTPVATAVVFAELAGTTIGAQLGGGTYSVATTAGAGARPAIATAALALAVVAAGAAMVQSGGASRARNAAMSSSRSG